MASKSASGLDLIYPAPRPAMVGGYLVRKNHVAAALRAIDLACAVIAKRSRPPVAIDESQIKSIVFAQCGHLGDLILTLPTLRWVRQHRPDIRIGLVAGTWAKPMLSGISELYDRCYFADHFMLNRSGQSLTQKLDQHRGSWADTARQLKSDGYDAAIDCYPFIQNSIPLLYSAAIPIRIGFTSGGFRPLLTSGLPWVHTSRSYLDYPRDLLRLLFSDPSLDEPFRAYYPMPQPNPSRPDTPYAVVHGGAGSSIREWPLDRWIELVNRMAGRGMTIALAGAGARDRDRCRAIVEAMSSNAVIDLSDKLSWDQLVDLIAHASYVVCLDSSTSHLAAAFNVPSTVIMPGINYPTMFGPANDKATTITFKTPCAPCFRGGGCEHMACVRLVGVDDVAPSVLKGMGTVVAG